MSPVIASSPPAENRGASTQGFLPFRPLALTGLAANVPALAFLMIAGHCWPALSVLAGLAVGLAVYGSLHLFVGRGLDPFLPGVRGRARPATGGATVLFAVLLPLKYLVLGGLMWLLWRSGHLHLVWFGIGFLTTQVTITVAAALPLMRRTRG